jgi:hypothetical protein
MLIKDIHLLKSIIGAWLNAPIIRLLSYMKDDHERNSCGKNEGILHALAIRDE